MKKTKKRPKKSKLPPPQSIPEKTNPIGRPRKDLNKENLKFLMRFKPSVYDVMGYFDISRNALDMFLKREFDMSFRTFREVNMSSTRLLIQQMAIQKAQQGDNGMIYFTLKNLAGWKDDPDSTDHEEEIDELEFSEGKE